MGLVVSVCRKVTVGSAVHLTVDGVVPCFAPFMVVGALPVKIDSALSLPPRWRMASPGGASFRSATALIGRPRPRRHGRCLG